MRILDLWSDGGAQRLSESSDIIFFALFVQHKFKRKKYRCVLLPYLLSVSRNTLLGLAVLVPVMRPIVDATIRTAHIVLSPSILHSTLSSFITSWLYCEVEGFASHHRVYWGWPWI